jgi:hypothetical protein
MAITELAIPSMKQDEVIRSALSNNLWPALASLLDEGKELKLRTVGMISSVNNTDLSTGFHRFLECVCVVQHI